eukprot:PhF_6_TR36546/c0_g1_i1/m.53905
MHMGLCWHERGNTRRLQKRFGTPMMGQKKPLPVYVVNWAQAAAKGKDPSQLNGLIQIASRIQTQQTPDARLLFNIGEIALEESHNDLEFALIAFHHFKRSFEIEKSAITMGYVAKALLQLGNHSEALSSAQEALQNSISGERGELYYILGEIAFEMKSYSQALEYYKASIETRSDDGMSEVYNKLALCEMYLGKLDQAWFTIVKSIQQDPQPYYVTKLNPYHTLARWCLKNEDQTTDQNMKLMWLARSITAMNSFLNVSKQLESYFNGVMKWVQQNADTRYISLEHYLQVVDQFLFIAEGCGQFYNSTWKSELTAKTAERLHKRIPFGVSSSISSSAPTATTDKAPHRLILQPHVKIVYLCCGNDEESRELQRSLFLLLKHFLWHFPFYQVIVYLEKGTGDPVEILQRSVSAFGMGFVHAMISIYEMSFSFPSGTDVSQVPKVVLGYGVGYRHMCRFFSGFIFLENEEKYDNVLGSEEDTPWILRLDSDSYFYDHVKEDFLNLTTLENHHADYIHLGGFRDNAVFTKGLWNTSNEILAFHTESTQTEKQWNRACFHTHFTLSRRKVFTGEKGRKYLHHLDQRGGFYLNRWGDACVHFLLMDGFEGARVKRLNVSIPYWHQTLLL